jgi:hypothetical protein
VSVKFSASSACQDEPRYRKERGFEPRAIPDYAIAA